MLSDAWLVVSPFKEFLSTYLVVVLVESLLASGLFVLLGIVYIERRSVSYLWLWLGSATLVIRSIIGLLPAITTLDPQLHILIDHGLDIILVGAVLCAVYYARKTQSVAES